MYNWIGSGPTGCRFLFTCLDLQSVSSEVPGCMDICHLGKHMTHDPIVSKKSAVTLQKGKCISLKPLLFKYSFHVDLIDLIQTHIPRTFHGFPTIDDIQTLLFEITSWY